MARQRLIHGRHLIDKASKANISDTQIATFDHGEVKVVWTHRTWGHAPDPQYPWGATLYGDRGKLQVGILGYDFTPLEKGASPIHRDVTYEFEQYPEDKTEPRLEKPVAPAIRRHMRNFLESITSRGKPVSDIEQGYISTTSCILANLSMNTGRSLTWDAARQRIAGDDAVNRLLRRPYRRPWAHADAKLV